MRPLYGREHELQVFREAANRADHDRREVVVFYGPGGQGKTQLCSAIKESIIDAGDRSARRPCCLVDFKAHGSRAAEALYTIRTALIPKKYLQRPLFDIAFTRYLERFSPGIDIKRRYPEMFLESRTSSSSNDVVDELLELGTGLATHIPFVTLLEKYARRLADHVGHERTKRLRSELADIDLWSYDEWNDRLPVLLARDVSELPCRHGVPLILFDHYEHLWEGGLQRDAISANADRWIRIFSENLSLGICVIFSRERLDHWSELSAYWQGGEPLQVALSDLSARSAIRMLKEAHVSEPAIRKRIVSLASGHPLFLQVQIETYRATARAGRTPRPEDFGVTKKDVISRFLDHLDPRDSLCLKVLSIPRAFEISMFDFLANKMPRAFLGLTFDAVSAYSFFQLRADGWAVMHSVMRSGLEALCEPGLKRQTHQAVFEYATQKWNEMADHSSAEAVALLKTAARHRVQYDEIGFLRWVLSIPEDYIAKDFYPEVEQARRVAEAHKLAAEEVECLWRLSFDAGDNQKAVLDRALAVIDEHPEIVFAKEMLIRVRRVDAMIRGLASKDQANAILQACLSATGSSKYASGLDACYRAHLQWCWANACYWAGDPEGRCAHLEASIAELPAALDGLVAQFVPILWELMNSYKRAGRLEDIRHLARDAAARVGTADALPAAQTHVPKPTRLWMEVADQVGAAAVADNASGRSEDTTAGYSKIVEQLRAISAYSDDQLARTVVLPSAEEGEEILKRSAVIAGTENIGLVVNTRGHMCLTHDVRFPVLIGPEFHLRYDSGRRRIYLYFDDVFADELDWDATDEMHEYLMKINKILVIRMSRKKPIEGYDCGFLVCSPHGR